VSAAHPSGKSAGEIGSRRHAGLEPPIPARQKSRGPDGDVPQILREVRRTAADRW
jgi:hypothetical protein